MIKYFLFSLGEKMLGMRNSQQFYLLLNLNLLGYYAKINVNKIDILKCKNKTITLTKSGLKSLLPEVEGGGWRRQR